MSKLSEGDTLYLVELLCGLRCCQVIQNSHSTLAKEEERKDDLARGM